MGRGKYDGFNTTVGGDTRHHTLTDNLSDVTKKFPLHEGYFGVRSQLNKKGGTKVRHIESQNPEQTGKQFYDTITKGAIRRTQIKDVGEYALMKDGSSISYRRISSSDGSPAAQIVVGESVTRVKQQKIHFTKKEKK